MNGHQVGDSGEFQVPQREKLRPPSHAPNAKEAALKEAVLIPRNPVVPLLRTITLIVLLDAAFLILINFLVIIIDITNITLFWFLSLFLITKIAYLTAYFFFRLLPWANTGYYLEKTKLVRKRLKRDISYDEGTYELRHIQQVRMVQGVLGLTFDYGNVILELGEPRRQRVILRDIKDPTHYKAVFEKYISVPAP